jgi:hypothetical protein
MGNFKGKQIVPEERAKIIDHFWTTCAGFAIPDPAVMSKYSSNFLLCVDKSKTNLLRIKREN